MTFVPRSKRGTSEEARHLALQEGVPDHFHNSLLDWVRDELLVPHSTPWATQEPIYSSRYLRGIELDMQVGLGTDDEMVNTLYRKAITDSDWFLDLLDYLLQNPMTNVYSRRRPGNRPYMLELILVRGRSAWRVTPLEGARRSWNVGSIRPSNEPWMRRRRSTRLPDNILARRGTRRTDDQRMPLRRMSSPSRPSSGHNTMS